MMETLLKLNSTKSLQIRKTLPTCNTCELKIVDKTTATSKHPSSQPARQRQKNQIKW